MIFLQNIENEYPLNAFNDNIVEFTEDDAVKAKIEVFGVGVFEITPLNGYFYFNFKEIFKVAINQNLFSDEINLIDGFIEDTSLFKNLDVKYETFDEELNLLDEKEFVYQIIKGVQQIEDDETKKNLLHEFSENNTFQLDIFEGFPFDITIFKPKEAGLDININSSFAVGTYDDLGKIYRVGFVNEEGQLMQQNFNEPLVLNKNYPNEIAIDVIDFYRGNIYYHEKCKGIYLKWFNTFGGWDYWLFSDKYKITPKDKSIGEINVNSNNIQNLKSINSQLGKIVSVNYSVSCDFLNKQQFQKVSKIVYSPKIYLWTGKKWIEVSIDFRTKYNSHQPEGRVEFDLRLPERFTQTI